MSRARAGHGTWPHADILRRAADVVFSGLLLLVCLPLLALAALAVRLDSPGPAFFRQERVGRRGRRFRVYKLRSMATDSPTFGPKPVSWDDDRVTRVGRFLRRSSLDELPQLLNVLQGDMSLVGPRPEQPFIVARDQPWQVERLEVLPGMTGWWQVNGRKQPMHEYVAEDLYYVRNRSFWLDLKIVALTVKAVVGGTGAV